MSHSRQKKTLPARVRTDEKVRVRTAKGRKLSSTLWLQRQLNDPYSQSAKRLGYRSRSAFKLMEIAEKFAIFDESEVVVDLGSAPGGWLQVACENMPEDSTIIGIDLLEQQPLQGVHLLQADFLTDEGLQALQAVLGGRPADVVLSDMAANSTGHYGTDRLRNMLLAEEAAEFAFSTLRQGGSFVCKVFGSANEGELLNRLKKQFAKVRHFKPQASRSGSPEIYVVALEFRGENNG